MDNKFRNNCHLIRAGIIAVLLLLSNIRGIEAQSYREREDRWVKQKMSEMSLDHKIGQLFMVRASSKIDLNEFKVISDYIKNYYIGGICFFKGSAVNQVNLINKYQQMAATPLFMGVDGEWGMAMRLPKESISFPKQMMLGAVKDNKLIYEMGREVARQCKRTGINLNFAPSVDINNNPSNPVIYDRSFGESPQNVTAKGYMYMKAMEDEGVMACIKHFPGHGDTDVDSHSDLPVLNHSLEKLEHTEFYPFRRLAGQGAGAIMVGHLQVPVLDDGNKMPASLSQKTIKNILRDDMGYNGLLITDAMDMKGITKYYSNGVAEAEAFLAGNDIILLPKNLPKAIVMIKTYLTEGKITEKRLNESIERILRAKYKVGLNIMPVLNPEGVTDYLTRNQAGAIKQKIIENAITLISDRNNLIPIVKTYDLSLATLSINVIQKTMFQQRIDNYMDARHYQLMPTQIAQQHQQLLQTLSQFDKVIIGIHTSGKQNDFSKDLPEELISFLSELNAKKEIIIVLFGNPYLLHKLTFADHLIISYDNGNITQDVTAQSIFGVNEISGQLPVTVNEKWPVGHGINKSGLQRLGYALPEMVGLSSDTLRKIDTIIAQMIKLNAAPGGQVLVAKDGKIILQKSYGKLSPDGYYVSENTMYDVASITKVLATTLSVMKLVDDHKISVKNPIRNYISGIDSTNKAKLTVQDIMAHHAGLQPGISFYQKTMLPKKMHGYNPSYYSGLLQDKYTIPVAKGMFMRMDYKDTMYQALWSGKLRDTDKYKYSDLGFYIMQKVVEGQSGKPLDEFTMLNFYKPMGLRHTLFRPLLKFPAQYIAPSEIDNYFRMQTLQGHVHDMGAAMLGGVGGHAGLFSTAGDMAVLMQMLLNKGIYGGIRYLSPETIRLFTTRHYKSSRRGLGFDMKELDPSKSKSMSELASASTFGHTGFTGTAVWADPENNIVFVFCANRTYPFANNRTFNNKDFRNKIQSVVYKAMKGSNTDIYL